MNIKRLLCPIDFSEFNRSANEYASMLAKSTGAKIVYFHAYLPDVYETPPAYFDAEKETSRLLKKLKEFIQPAHEDIDAQYVVEPGTATSAIVQYAAENNVDLIVMSTHGRTGFSRLIMGSVAEAVVRKADCPVLALKAAAEVLQQN